MFASRQSFNDCNFALTRLRTYMHYSNFILLGLLTAGACSSVFAQETPNESADQSNTTENQVTTEQKNPTTIQAIKDLKHLTKNDLKVNANAAQPDAIKDPLQPLNRQNYAFNEIGRAHV